jgi:hypothetical protein
MALPSKIATLLCGLALSLIAVFLLRFAFDARSWVGTLLAAQLWAITTMVIGIAMTTRRPH